MGEGNGFYYINPSHVMNGHTYKVGRGRRGKWSDGPAPALNRRALSPRQVVNMTFLSLWDCQLECKGTGGKGIVNSERLINLLHLRFSPASFSVYCDPYEQRGERPGCRRPRQYRRLIPNELLTEFFE